MSGTIPAHIEPRRLADRGIALKGTVSAARMTRLSALRDAPAGEVQVELNFNRDEQGISAMQGHDQLEVALICQRCLERVVLELDAECDVWFVASDEAAKNLPRHYEPVIL